MFAKGRECSTPFGITEGVTAARRPAGRSCRGAQRLSASQRASQPPVSLEFIPFRCSTPFGITEGVTGAANCARTSLSECSTPFGITEGVTRQAGRPERMQDRVLNAFRHHRGRHPRSESRIDSPSCAQRLSASQRASRRYSGPDPQPERRVLNAFRHHRGRHAVPKNADLFAERCSTPFGITEGVTTGQTVTAYNPSCAQRLSASQRASPSSRAPI